MRREAATLKTRGCAVGAVGLGYAVAFCVLAWTGQSAVAAELRFDQPVYTASPGETFTVSLYLDMNPAAAGAQPPGAGLFSAGARAAFDPTMAAVTDVADIILPAALDHGAFGGPAERDLGAGSAGALGLVEATTPYDGALVLTLKMTAVAPGTFDLTPALFYDDTRANFVDGAYNVLDGQITNLVSSVVTVSGSVPPEMTGIARSGGDVVLSFTHAAGAAGPYVVEGASSLLPAGAWSPEAGALVTTNAPGIYTARVAVGSFTQRLYRIREP